MKISKDFKLNLIDISKQLEGYEIVSFKITYKNQIIILGKELISLENEENKKHKVLIISSDGIEEIIIKKTDLNFTHVDILPDNQIILAFPRVFSDLDKNLQIFDFKGNFIREFLIGDGIEDLQTTSDNEIWTSYFDEGIFGNNKIGTKGLVCWNKFGELIYEFNPSENLGYIYDCYSLNVLNSNETLISYYSSSEGFPIVKIKNKEKLEYWNNSLSGFHNFSIFDKWILTSNGYYSKSFYLLKLLEDNKSEIIELFFFFDENGNPLNETKVKMRNDLICFRNEYKLYITSLREILK